MTESLVINKRQGQIIDCMCRDCHRSTRHEIITEVTANGHWDRGGHEVSWETEYQIVRCRGCEGLSFRRDHSHSEDMGTQIGEDEWEVTNHEELFPSPHSGRQPICDARLLPDKVQIIYTETLVALNGQQEVLCGIGIRAILETVCKNKNAKGSNLFEKIGSLVALGVLTQDGVTILQKLRTLGNDSAHDVKPHTSKELGLAFDVLDHLMLGVYIIPEQAKQTFK